VDIGIGIPEGQQQNIFQEFVRMCRRRNDSQVSGLGIGLSYAWKAVQYLPEHELRMNSQLGRGSDFQLYLPIAENFSSADPVFHHNNQQPLSGRLIFVIEDDKQVLNALAKQLEGWGCLVECASSLAELHQILNETLRPPDLVITDFYLAENETAHQIIATVHAECGSVPILILSAHGISLADKIRLPENTELLRKPVVGEVLLGVVRRAIENNEISPTNKILHY
jgi:CheY-like chemotaxis protein